MQNFIYENYEYILKYTNNKFNKEDKYYYDDKLFSGNGKIYQDKYVLYDGTFENGSINKGKLYYYEKKLFKTIYYKLYDGKFINGKYNKGKLFYKDKIIYKGNFNDDIKHGYGILYHDEYIYEGEFKDDMKHGKGIINFTNGNILYGNWNNDELEGKAIIYFLVNNSISDDCYGEYNYKNGVLDGTCYQYYSKCPIYSKYLYKLKIDYNNGVRDNIKIFWCRINNKMRMCIVQEFCNCNVYEIIECKCFYKLLLNKN
jgi:hypothetical protein